MVAGKDRKPASEVNIQSIILRGNGIERTLIPLKKGIGFNELFPEHYLSETDFSFQGTFFFFGLPTGKYELTVNAKGYEPSSQKCDVMAGQYQNTIIIEPMRKVIDPP